MAKDSATLPRFTIPWSLIPMKLLVGAAVLSTLVREFFPLSYFAMYAGMYPSADYVYVTDLSGEPIALQTETHTRTAHLKRAHHAYYLEELERLGGSHRSEQAAAIAGKRVMQWLVDDSPRPTGSSPALHRVSHASLHLGVADDNLHGPLCWPHYNRAVVAALAVMLVLISSIWLGFVVPCGARCWPVALGRHLKGGGRRGWFGQRHVAPTSSSIRYAGTVSRRWCAETAHSASDRRCSGHRDGRRGTIST